MTTPPWKCSQCGSTDALGRAKGLCRRCYNTAFKARLKATNPEYRADESRRACEEYRQLKWAAIQNLGAKCHCCGEASLEFLLVVLVDGRRPSSATFYKDIRKQGYPQDKYRLLCRNCYWAIRNWGYCPHKHARTERFPRRLTLPPGPPLAG